MFFLSKKLGLSLFFLGFASTQGVAQPVILPVPSECLTVQNQALVVDAKTLKLAREIALRYPDSWSRLSTDALEKGLEDNKIRQKSREKWGETQPGQIAMHKDVIFGLECYLKHRRGGATSAPNVQPNKNSRNTQQQPDKLPDIPEPTGDVSKCKGPHNELSAEFERRRSTVDTDDIVVNLAMLHWIGPQMRDIWQTCDTAVAQAYEKLSVKALEMCLPRTSDPRLCKDPFASRVASSAQPTRGSSDQDPAVEGGGGYAIKAQKPKKTTLSPAARKALERAAVASKCIKWEPWAVDGLKASNTCLQGKDDQGLTFFGV